MKSLPNFSHYRVRVIALGLIVLLTSCKQLGQSNILPAAEEVPTPGSIDPGMELSSNYLICPSIPKTDPLIPPGPYDEQLGDCALRGKSDEIEAWLTTLEQIADSCQANGEANWAATLAARDYLDSKIDEIEEEETETTSVNTGVSLVLNLLQQVQGTGGASSSGDSTSPIEGILNAPNRHFTQILKSIGEDVEIYCIMIDELVKPLWLACNEINNYQDSHSPDLELYHSMIEAMANAAQANYENTDDFFTNTLQTNDWTAFRNEFNELSIDCPLDPQAPNTKFTFFNNTFCRIGPSLEYEKVATFLQGQYVQIDGRNQSEPRWWWVLIPGSSGHCWVSDSTGSATGFLEDVDIVAAPSPKAKICSKDLGQSACLAAGGKWVDGGAVGASYCDCK